MGKSDFVHDSWMIGDQHACADDWGRFQGLQKITRCCFAFETVSDTRVVNSRAEGGARGAAHYFRSARNECTPQFHKLLV